MYGMKKFSYTIIILIVLVILFWSFPFSVMAEEQNNNEAEMEPIVVTGFHDAEFPSPTSPLDTRYGTQYNIITNEQIKQQDSKDFKDTLRNVPGVMFQSRNLMGEHSSTSLYIRGRGASHPSSDFAILFDGVPRYGALYGQVLGDGIAVSTIDRIELFKSPQPSQFGSGYASINIKPKHLYEDGKELILSASGGSYRTFIESISGGIKDGKWDFYVSQSWGSTDGSRDNSRAQQQGYYVNIGYQLNENWNIRLLANYVDGQTNVPRPDPIPPAPGVSWPTAERFDTKTFFTTLTLNHKYKNSEGYIKAYWNDTTFDILQELTTNGQRYAGGSGGLWSRQDVNLYGIRIKEKVSLWERGEIIAGVDLDMTSLKNTQKTYSGQAHPGINGGLAERIWDFPNTTIFSPYAAISQEFEISDKSSLIPSAGFRYYYHNEFENKASAQAGLVIGYGNTDLSLNYARGINYPTPAVLQGMVLTSAPVANPRQYWENIKPEVVDHFEVGLTHTMPEIATFGVTAFHDKGKDRFRAYMGGVIPPFNDTTGRYRIRGLELSATVTPTNDVEIFAGATWLKAEATGSDGIKQNKMPYTPKFALQAGFSWRFLESFKLYMDVQHFNGVYQGTNRRPLGFDFPLLTDADKLDDITVVNARLSYNFDYAPWRLKDSEFFIAVSNILNKKYEYAKGYRMPGTTFFIGLNFKFK